MLVFAIGLWTIYGVIASRAIDLVWKRVLAASILSVNLHWRSQFKLRH